MRLCHAVWGAKERDMVLNGTRKFTQMTIVALLLGLGLGRAQQTTFTLEQMT